MKYTVKYALWLLPLLVFAQGCDQKKVQAAQQQTLAPPIVDAPPPKPATVSTADLPPPEIGTTPPADDKQEAQAPAETPKKPVHHRKPPAATTPSATQEASNTTPAPAPNSSEQPSVSAIGQLSGGASGDLRTETEETIVSTEKGVNSITRNLNDSETKTVAHIRDFLKEARQALTTGDVDGAHTLATKAKVLLTELNQ